MNFAKSVSLNLSAGGKVGGNLEIDGDLTVNGDSSGAYDEIINGHLDLADNNILNVGDISLDTISSDAGTSINVVLGSDAGDDFLVDTDKLVVEGDTGKVGIGTAAPLEMLDVSKANDGGLGPVLQLTNDPGSSTSIGTSCKIKFAPHHSGTEVASVEAIATTTGAGTALKFTTHSGSALTEKMRIDKDGNVGIGSNDPDSLLHVKTTVDSSETIRLQNDDTLSTLGVSSDGYSFLTYQTALHIVPWDGSTWGGTKVIVDANGKVGIGDTSPDALLCIKGDSDSNTTPSIRLKDGSDTREAWISNTSGDLVLANGGDDNTPHCMLKMFDGNIMQFATAGLERMRITSTGNVYLGGVTSQVNSSHFQYASTFGDTSAARVGFFNAASGNASTDKTLAFNIGCMGHGTSAWHPTNMVIASLNFIGQANDATYAGGGIDMLVSTGGDIARSAVGTDMLFRTMDTSSTGGTEKMRIASNGNVGINETSPSAKLHVALDNGTMPSVVASESALVLQNNSAVSDGCTLTIISGNENNSQICFGDEQDYDRGVMLYNHNHDKFSWRTSGAGEDMTLNENGRLGIGNTNPAHTLTVEDNVNAYTVSFKNNRNPSSSAPYVAMFRFHETPDNGTSEFLRCDDSVGSSAVARLIISSEGDVTNHDNSYGATSDRRIKQGIKDANSQWDDIKAVKVRNFKKNDDVAQYGDKAWEQIGVIAQELEEAGMDKLVKEHLASESEVSVNDDINEGDMVKTVSYSVLYMKSIKALQEAMTKIETLEAKVESLENA